jgi:hypothetical protein
MEDMNGEAFHDAQEEMTHSDEQPSQKQRTVITFDPSNINNFNPVTFEASQTNLITRAVEDLIMNPDEGTDVKVPNAEAMTEDNELGKGIDSLSTNFTTAAANIADAATAKSDPSLIQSEKEVQDYDERKETEWHKSFIT